MITNDDGSVHTLKLFVHTFQKFLLMLLPPWLLLETKPPVMMPNGVDFCFFFPSYFLASVGVQRYGLPEEA